MLMNVFKCVAKFKGATGRCICMFCHRKIGVGDSLPAAQEGLFHKTIWNGAVKTGRHMAGDQTTFQGLNSINHTKCRGALSQAEMVDKLSSYQSQSRRRVKRSFPSEKPSVQDVTLLSMKLWNVLILLMLQHLHEPFYELPLMFLNNQSLHLNNTCSW